MRGGASVRAAAGASFASGAPSPKGALALVVPPSSEGSASASGAGIAKRRRQSGEGNIAAQFGHGLQARPFLLVAVDAAILRH